MKLFKSKRGFTLIELIVVIAILGVLSAIMIPSMNGYIKDSKVARAAANARTLYAAAMLVNVDYPILNPIGSDNYFQGMSTWITSPGTFPDELKKLLGDGFEGFIAIESGSVSNNTYGRVMKVKWRETAQDAITGVAP